jgi:hypothetical protein
MSGDRRAVRGSGGARSALAATVTAGALLLAPLGAGLSLPVVAQAKPPACDDNPACLLGSDKKAALSAETKAAAKVKAEDSEDSESSARKYKFAVLTVDDQTKNLKYAGKLIVKVGPGVKFKFKPAPEKTKAEDSE